MTYLSYAERMIISASTVVVLGVLIFAFILLYKKQRVKMLKTKMLTMNDVIKYKHFMPFVKYQIKQEEDFAIILFQVDNLDILSKQYTNQIVTAYLRRLAKNVSMHLTYGAKLAQTPQRNLFAVYVPFEENLDLNLLSQNMKEAASEALYLKNSIVIKKNISAGYAVNDKNNSYTELMDKAMMALVSSKRELGELTPYTENSALSIIDYRTVLKNLKLTEMSFTLYDTYNIMLEEFRDYILTVKVNNLAQTDFLKQIPNKDQAWVNLWLVEMIFASLNKKNIKGPLLVPMVLRTLEANNIPNFIENLALAYEIDLDSLTIELTDSDISSSQKVIENILNLKELGIKFSYNITNVSPEIYHSIQGYHVTTLNLNEQFIINNQALLDELLYFARVNHLDVLVKSDEGLSKEMLDKYHATLYAKISSKNTLFTDTKSKKRAKGVKK